MLSTASRIGAARARQAIAPAPACARAAPPAPLRYRPAARAALVTRASATTTPIRTPPPPKTTTRRRTTTPKTTLNRRPALRVVAYREHRDIDRERTICALGDRVVGAMMRALARPPSTPAPALADVQELRGDTVASGLEVRIDSVLDKEELVGTDALLAWIERERKEAPPCSGWSLIASAACPADDAFFALVETVHPREDAGGKPRDPLTLHKIVWFDVELDDTKRQVTGVHVRGQLAPDDLSALVSVDSAHRALSATPFPHDRVKPYPKGLNVDIPLSNQRRWCAARCSRNDARAQLLGDGGKTPGLELPAIDEARFRLWDAFGTLPVLCNPARRAQPDACVVPGDTVADIIAGAKERFTIDCRMQDAAVSFDKTVSFTRWLSLCEDRKSGEKFKIEGLEAVIFDEEGRLLDIHLYRDPTPAERARLMGE